MCNIQSSPQSRDGIPEWEEMLCSRVFVDALAACACLRWMFWSSFVFCVCAWALLSFAWSAEPTRLNGSAAGFGECPIWSFTSCKAYKLSCLQLCHYLTSKVSFWSTCTEWTIDPCLCLVQSMEFVHLVLGSTLAGLGYALQRSWSSGGEGWEGTHVLTARPWENGTIFLGRALFFCRSA